jgi:RHS repeat-associated protein
LHPVDQSEWTLLEQYEYDAFGFPYFHSATGAKQGPQLYGNRFLFAGREWLGELRLYDYRNRMYQPELGRFLQPDPKQFAAGDYNLYRYCHNDPVNKSDPLGLDPMVVDQETDRLAHDGLSLSLTATLNNQWLGGILFRYEFATTVLGSAQGKFLSETRTSKKEREVEPPSVDGMDSLAETHSHTFIPMGGNYFTHVNLSKNDINRGIRYGRPQYVIAPNGVRERYRPSDKKTEAERKGEGGIIERWEEGKWKRVSGANTDMNNFRAARNGY